MTGVAGEEVLVPEVIRRGPYSRQAHDLIGRKKGTRLRYRWKTRPYIHQVEAIKKLLSTGFGGALLMEPRTGKTKVAIDYANIMHAAGKVGRVLVICPVSVLGVWQDQIPMHSPYKTRVLVWDKDSRKDTRLPSYGSDSLDFVIVNYDAFSTPGAITGRDAAGNIKRSRSRGGRYTMKKTFTQDWVPDLIILDESHRIKSPSAAKSRMLHTLGAAATYRLILTGTLVTKKKRIFDVYSQWKFLNPERFGDMTFSQFKAWLGVWVDKPTRKPGVTYPFWVKNSERSIRIMHKEIHKDAFSVTREECFDLPPRLPPVLTRVPLSDRTGKIYDEMAEEMVAKIHTGEIIEASIPLVVRLRLQQITSGLAKTTGEMGAEGKLRIIGNEKLRMLEDYLEDQFELDEKVVIGALFRPDIMRIERMITKKFKVPAYELHGGIPRKQRDVSIAEFRAHQGAGAFIMQPQAGSLGIDLSTASTMIWYSLTSSYVDFTQSEDRIALSGKANRYIYLLGGPVDELMYQTLQEDADVSKAIAKRPEILLREH